MPFDHPFQVRLHDTDAAGVLFFAHLLRHAHDAYEAWMEQAGQALPAWLAGGGPHLPLVHAEADYLAPLRHGDRVSVRLTLERLGETSFTLAYTFTTADGRPAARARTVHAAAAAGAKRPLPEGLRAALRGLGE